MRFWHDRQMIGHCIHRLMWKYNGLEIDNIVCEISSLMTENIKFTPLYFHINLCMQCPIIWRSCQNLIIWKLLLYEQLVLKGTIIEKWRWLTAAVKNEWPCWTREYKLSRATFLFFLPKLSSFIDVLLITGELYRLMGASSLKYIM
jgi:hypothetical protein